MTETPEAVLACVHCHQPIDTTGNHVPNPPMHVHCWAAHRPTETTQTPHEDPAVRKVTRDLRMRGHAVTGPYRASDHGTRVCEDPNATAGWDHRDGHLPWVVVSQTPCLREDLGREDPALDSWQTPVHHTCRLKHIHTGSRHAALTPARKADHV